MRSRKSIRLRNWDYSNEGYYFVTICSYKNECIFGEIVNAEMKLNESGKLIDKHWKKLPEKYKNVDLNKHIVMPNHLHGIIQIKIQKNVGVSFMKPDNIEHGKSCHQGRDDKQGRDKSRPYDNDNFEIGKSNHHMGLINHTPTLGLIIRYFKAKCSYELHKMEINQKIWQRNYYERIIRNKKESNKIGEYVSSNPLKWHLDKNNPKNINYV